MRIPVFIALTFMSLMIGGCFQYQESIRFNSDGSGTVVARLVIPLATRDLLVTDGDSTRYEAMLRRLSKRSIDDYIRRDGISIGSIESYDTDSGYVAEVRYSFSDLEAFRRTRNEGRDVSLLALEDGLYELQLVFSSPAEAADASDQTGGDQDIVLDASRDPEALHRALTALHVRYKVHVPTRVISAPGAHFAADSAEISWRYDDHRGEAPQSRELRVIFARGGLRWPTFEAVPLDGEDFAPQQDAWDR